MRAPVVALFTLVASAAGYSVSRPNAVQGWTNVGAQVLTWSRVDTDPFNFTALLTNQRIPGFESQVLAALVDGTLGNTTLNPPGGSGGNWPLGSGFRLNLVRDANSLDSILAQSGEFNITEPETNGTRPTGTTTVSFNTVPVTNTATTPTDSITVLPTGGASHGQVVSGSLLALAALMGLTLA